VIQYSLKCDRDHRFDSWFKSASAFDKLQAAGMVACSVCGSTEVEKALMAPRISAGREEAEAPLSTPASPAEQALAELKRRIAEHAEYVGKDFATEARRIHEGEAPERLIYGEARPDDARRLIEDGVQVTPLPFLPERKTN
jgi:hypothetical protein